MRNRRRGVGEFASPATAPWNLGRWAAAVNSVAVLWIATIVVVFSLPPNELVLWTMLLLALRGGCRPAVILRDLTMPIMNGWEFRHEQRQDSELSRIPVVVVSGVNDSARHAEWLEADDYVRKPIPAEVLLATVQRYCDRAPRASAPEP